MAISLGDINFALGADLDALSQSLNRLRAFGKEVERVSRSQADGADKVAAAYRKQEAAVTSALQKTLNLNSAIRRTGGNAEMVSRVNNAFSLYANQLTSTNVKALTLQRANERLAASLNQVKRELDDIKKRKHEDTMNRLLASLQNLSSAAVLFSGPLGGLAARLTAVATLASRVGASMALLITGFALGTYAAYKFGEAIIANARKLNVAQSALLAISGSQETTNRLMREARTIAQRSGQVYTEVAVQYSRFLAAARGTALAGQKSAEVFETVAKTVGKLQLPTEQAEGVFRALEQMMSKGTIQAEELRGQLGDRLPGAFQIMARALDVSTVKLNQMLKNGQVLASDALPKFADELRKTFNLSGDVDNFQASINRVKNAWAILLDTFDQVFGISALAKSALDAVRAAMDFLTQRVIDAYGAWQEIKIVILEVAGALLKFGNIVGRIAIAVWEGFKGMFTRVGDLFDAFKKDLQAFLVNPTGSQGFTNLTAALEGGFTSAFTDAFDNALAGANQFNADIDAAIGKNAETLRARAAELRNLYADGLLGLGSPEGGTGGGSGGASNSQEMAKRLKALRDANQELSRTQETLQALATGGIPAMERLQRTFEQQDKLARYADLLKEAGLGADAAAEKLNAYRIAIEAVDPAIEAAQRQQAAIQELQQVGERAFDRLGQSFNDWVTGAKKGSEILRDTLQSVVSDITNTFIQLAVTNPIKNSLFGGAGGFAPTLGSVGSGGGLFDSIGSFFGGFAAKGAAYSGGVRFLAKGGLLDRPTVFNTQSGLAVGGEAGTEAVMPLGRTSDGRLGVLMAGGSSGQGKKEVHYHIDARGASQQSIRELESRIMSLAGPGVIESRVHDAQWRGMLQS